ncbi:zf-HC2 domain-containing protein [Streptomyces sp. SCA3-4]|uniref:zf-HC2 domain-containing protein n=1 Tax=Streptomyces sichuanensis TaxID=2871810 RepID=UPI001CE36181|nr:zf-HC2 domain-containing protein [Streptomyces sichuanensis]MCA6094560.1 zf-HC2 domain-containing protein [Streptomyces sichuanensis]
MNRPAPDQEHTAVGAYALGALGDADAARFEEHLAGCARCAAELDDLMGLTPLLGELKESAPDPAFLTPRPELLDRLLDDVTVTRRAQRSRRLWLVAAAVALIVAGPLAGAALIAQDPPAHSSVSAAKEMYEDGEKKGAVDPVTQVDATVSLQSKPWGTHVALRLGHVKGPLTCDLVAVGRNGQEQTVTTWAVPPAGYGLADAATAWAREPLYTHGGAAFDRADIARFEVRTLDGKRLATVPL